MAFAMTHLSAPTGAEALFAWKALLKLSGYTVPNSSDGTTYGSGSDVITTGASGAGGLGNANAWVVLQNPDGPSYCIQQGSDHAHWRIKYSHAAGFSGGSPSATQVPSAADEAVMLGSGTDAFPGFGVFFQADGSYRFNVGCFDASPRLFYTVAFQAGGGNPNHGMYLDGLLAGTFDAGDTDHFMAYVDGTGAAYTSSIYNDASKFRTSLLGTVSQGHLNNMGPSPTSAGLNPNRITGKDDLLPVLFGVFNAGIGAIDHLKGESAMLKWETVGSGTSPRPTPFALTDGISPIDQMVFGNLVFPWDGSAVIV